MWRFSKEKGGVQSGKKLTFLNQTINPPCLDFFGGMNPVGTSLNFEVGGWDMDYGYV